METISFGEISFKFEPIVNPAGNVFGFEVLIRDIKHKDYSTGKILSFSELRLPEKIDVFNMQLDLFYKRRHIYHNNKLKVSLNVDLDIGEHIVSSGYLQKKLKEMSFIRLEIHEEFPELYLPQPHRILQELSTCCVLWLDDFTFEQEYVPLRSRPMQFEFIKIDKNFFWKHQGTSQLTLTLKQLKEVSAGVIIEGIETIEQKSLLNGLEVAGMQGYLWPAHLQPNL